MCLCLCVSRDCELAVVYLLLRKVASAISGLNGSKIVNTVSVCNQSSCKN